MSSLATNNNNNNNNNHTTNMPAPRFSSRFRNGHDHRKKQQKQQERRRLQQQNNNGHHDQNNVQQKYIGVFDKLSWRMDPSISYSDWTIEIIRQSNNSSITGSHQTKTNRNNDEQRYDNNDEKKSSSADCQKTVDRYHVHRSVLAVGPRHSEYFAAQFQLSMQENVERTSRIILDDDRANVFPWLLDFIYSNDDDDVDDLDVDVDDNVDNDESDNSDNHSENITTDSDSGRFGSDDSSSSSSSSSSGDDGKVMITKCNIEIDDVITTPQEKKLQINSSTFTAEAAATLYNLAEYLDIPQLRDTMYNYYIDNLNMSNVVEYISSAKRQHAEGLLDAAIVTCVEQLLDMDPIQTAKYIEPEFLLQVLETNNTNIERGRRRRRYGFHVSKLVVESCFGQYQDNLTREIFDKLTNKNLLPYMEPKAAVRLLSLDASLPQPLSSSDGLKMKQEEQKPFQNGYDSSSQQQQKQQRNLPLSCLQQRCSQSITQSRLPATEDLAIALAQVPSNVLIDIVMRVTSEIGLRAKDHSTYEEENCKRPPPRIYVDGAGFIAANGVYACDGTYDGTITYKKPGEYKGTPCMFKMYKFEEKWYIGVIPPDAEPGSHNDIDFYRSRAIDGYESIPPLDGWRALDDEDEPSPSILY